MSKTLFLRALYFCLFLCSFSFALQRTQGTELKFADLGDLKLENGETLKDCRLGYRTFGQLNAARNNAILFPTWFGGKSDQLVPNVGPDKMLDADAHFIVLIDALSNGVSSSPSNSGSQPKEKFPRITIRDMVRAEYLLATKELGLNHVRAVMGISMGGMQTFQWIISYPDYMEMAIPIVGTPRQSTYDLLLWTSQEQSIVEHLQRGDEKLALEDAARFSDLAIATPQYVLNESKGEDFAEFISKYDSNWKNDNRPYDYLSQLRAMIGHNIAAPASSMDDAAGLVKAKMLIVVARQDHMVNPAAALQFAALRKATTLVLEGECGHLATMCEEKTMAAAVRGFLTEK